MANEGEQKKVEKKPAGEGKPRDAGAPKGAGHSGGGGKKKAAEAAALAAQGPKTTPRLKKMYDESVKKKVAEKFGIENVNAIPRVAALVININMGRHLEGAKLPPNVKQTVLDTITNISGQKPIVLRAKKSVSNFKVREGVETAAMVTLRRDRMWHFLDRLINLATPRIKDFRGLKTTAFDRQGNYSLGLNEQGVFPEIDMAAATFTHGMNITVVVKNSNPEQSRYLLEELGMPFRKPEAKKGERAA
jgi:large subunit ribosomal protein L5